MFNQLKEKGITTRIAIALFDAISIMLCGGFAFLVRFDFTFSKINPDYVDAWFKYLPVEILVTILIFVFTRMYSFEWNSVTAGDFVRIIVVTAASNVLLFILKVMLGTFIPKSVMFMSMIFEMFMFTGVRFIFRINNGLRFRAGLNERDYQRIMIIGAGATGRIVMREFSSNSRLDSKVCCFIDDDKSKWGTYIEGVKVVGGRGEISHYVKSEHIDQIVLAIPSTDSGNQREILDICKGTGCKLKKIPGIYQIVNGEVETASIKDVQIEDLLGRDPIDLDTGSLEGFLKGKTVLVTGGGGSIGSELCRQIVRYEPKKLVIVDIYENNAYEIQQELIRNYGAKLNLSVEIASVRDKAKIDRIFDIYRPNVVFHAAAHKHVPLMESCPSEAIKNNIFGTWHVVRAAEKMGADKFVMISTDKAVNPTNIMGATKRFCEMMLMCKKESPTSFSCVRFGNVLGSNGSVVPLFKKQISEGGPVTITDKRIIRYFMTIPEAASLVLDAGAMAGRNQIFVLDMGEPVKILDLAENLIRLSGLEPDKDIKIKEIGLRPGEKLYEELLMSSGDLSSTLNKKIFVEEQEDIPESYIMNCLEALDEMITRYDALQSGGKYVPGSDAEIFAMMHDFVPTYKDPEQVNSYYDKVPAASDPA